MWLECVSDKAYPDRESLADDVVRVLREEARAPARRRGGGRPVRRAGADGGGVRAGDGRAVVHVRGAGRRKRAGRGAGVRRPAAHAVVSPGCRGSGVALHVCRGNWSRDEGVALTGPYTPLVPLLAALPVGTFFLEMATPRAGELAPLRDLPADSRIGLGVVNQKLDRVESVEEIVARAGGGGRDFRPGAGAAEPGLRLRHLRRQPARVGRRWPRRSWPPSSRPPDPPRTASGCG